MTYLIIILCCLVVAFAIWKIKWFLANVWLLLFSVSVIGLLLIPVSISIGITIATVCVGIMIGLFFITLISYFVTAVIVAPLVTVWFAIKNIFTK